MRAGLGQLLDCGAGAGGGAGSLGRHPGRRRAAVVVVVGASVVVVVRRCRRRGRRRRRRGRLGGEAHPRARDQRVAAPAQHAVDEALLAEQVAALDVLRDDQLPAVGAVVGRRPLLVAQLRDGLAVDRDAVEDLLDPGVVKSAGSHDRLMSMTSPATAVPGPGEVTFSTRPTPGAAVGGRCSSWRQVSAKYSICSGLPGSGPGVCFIGPLADARRPPSPTGWRLPAPPPQQCPAPHVCHRAPPACSPAFLPIETGSLPWTSWGIRHR